MLEKVSFLGKLLKNSEPKKWTDQKPTEPGWFWIRSEGSHEIVRVAQSEASTNGLCALLLPIEPGAEGEAIDLEEMDVEWFGPLEIPS
ncbi:MAG: hypothetical protein JSR62_05995 [Nitrospira sp.]|jgi:hypothetical protein|nr:hypothetical protein [Nitrospira sp.]